MNGKFDFGNRRIVGIGHSKYVSIPIVWLKNCGLEKGDFVQVILGNDGSLVLRPIKKGRTARKVSRSRGVET